MIPDASAASQDGGAGAAGLEVVWSIYAHAVADTLLTPLASDALLAIDQGFQQSPYIARRSDNP
jgi:hypothetical protein